jgi:hypothetical protein
LFDFVLAVNLHGSFAIVRACQSLLKASGCGLAVNVGSVAGIRGGGSNIHAAAKRQEGRGLLPGGHGKRHEMPAHHKLEVYIDEYLKAAGIAGRW